MADPLDSVNEIARLFLKWEDASRKDGNLPVAAKHGERAEALKAVMDELRTLRRWKQPVPASYGDISDLPDALLAQLSGIKTDELEDQIYAIVKAAGESIELDRLLIELFRRHAEIYERRFINNKCYRMAQKGLIFQVPGRKGVYTTIKPEVAEEFDEELSFTSKPQKPEREEFNTDLDDEIPF